MKYLNYLEMIHTKLHNITYLQQIIQINNENLEWYTVIELLISEQRESSLIVSFVKRISIMCFKKSN